METKTIIIIILFIISGIFYYQIGDTTTKSKIFQVERVIDGDTLILTNEQRIRLKGINTPEKSMPFYNEATKFLKNTENKSVTIKSYGVDKYGRTLAYVFLDNKNINKEILSRGLGTLYYYGEDDYYLELKQAEESARLNNNGLWKKSQNADCIELIELKYKEQPKRCTNNEFLELKNSCNKELNIIIKDDARHTYKETIKSNSIFTKNFSCIWNNDGDSVYIRDNDGLILFYRY